MDIRILHGSTAFLKIKFAFQVSLQVDIATKRKADFADCVGEPAIKPKLV
jgi:hypothetical protein